jgi:co-chaperonin GroES (HSP10)
MHQALMDGEQDQRLVARRREKARDQHIGIDHRPGHLTSPGKQGPVYAGSMKGTIVAVGPGAREEDGKIHPLDVAVGDCVLFGKWSGTEIRLDGEELIVIKESDLMGVVEKTMSHKAA